jgi:cell division cycle protein 20 (cofactor of APC complex)
MVSASTVPTPSYTPAHAHTLARGPSAGRLGPRDPLAALFTRAHPGDADAGAEDTFSAFLRPSSAAPAAKRVINTAPLRVMDAPNIRNDFYLSHVDWSSQDKLAVALDESVYVWDSNTDAVAHLLRLHEMHEHVCSVVWAPTATQLYVSSADGCVHMIDAESGKIVAAHQSHGGRVGALACLLDGTVASGGRDGAVFLWDPREQHSSSSWLQSVGEQRHGEVCGLSWNASATYLAAGYNDNYAAVFDRRYLSAPRLELKQHGAAVKALAWCPWETHVLATGAGSGDRHLRVFDTNSGELTAAADTENQLSAIVWSTNPRHRELVTAHGFQSNSLVLWDADKLAPVADFTSHSARILSATLSPDGETLCSASADETLRLWSVWGQRGVAGSRKARQPRDTSGKGLGLGIDGYQLNLR